MTDTPTARPEPHGLGGWLILPMLGTIMSPILSAYGVFQNINAFIEYRYQQSDAWSYVVIGEAVVTVVMIVGWIVALFMMFQHKRLYPQLFVFMVVATLVLNVADILVVSSVLGHEFDLSSIRDVVRPLLSLLIWGPYMFLSKRVRNTFVN